MPESRRVRSRVATALRMPANSLRHAKDYLGEFFRHITRKLGKLQAITATAHKLSGNKPHNSGFSSCPYRTDDVPWKSAFGKLEVPLGPCNRLRADEGQM